MTATASTTRPAFADGGDEVYGPYAEHHGSDFRAVLSPDAMRQFLAEERDARDAYEVACDAFTNAADIESWDIRYVVETAARERMREAFWSALVERIYTDAELYTTLAPLPWAMISVKVAA